MPSWQWSSILFGHRILTKDKMYTVECSIVTPFSPCILYKVHQENPVGSLLCNKISSSFITLDSFFQVLFCFEIVSRSWRHWAGGCLYLLTLSLWGLPELRTTTNTTEGLELAAHKELSLAHERDARFLFVFPFLVKVFASWEFCTQVPYLHHLYSPFPPTPLLFPYSSSYSDKWSILH